MKKLKEFVGMNIQTIVAVLAGLNFVGLIAVVVLLVNVSADLNKVKKQTDDVKVIADLFTYLEISNYAEKSEDPLWDMWSDAVDGVRVKYGIDAGVVNGKNLNAVSLETRPNVTISPVSENAYFGKKVVVETRATTSTPTTETTATTTKAKTSFVDVKDSYAGQKITLTDELSLGLHHGESLEVKLVPCYQEYTADYCYGSDKGSVCMEYGKVVDKNPNWEYVLILKDSNGKYLNYVWADSENFVDAEFEDATVSNYMRIGDEYYTANAIIDKLLVGETPPEKLQSVVVWTANRQFP